MVTISPAIMRIPLQPKTSRSVERRQCWRQEPRPAGERPSRSPLRTLYWHYSRDAIVDGASKLGRGWIGCATRKSLRLPRLHPLLGLGLALASALVLVYGIWPQPPGYHPFDPNPGWWRWFLNRSRPGAARADLAPAGIAGSGLGAAGAADGK